MTVLYLYYNQPSAIAFFESLGYDKLDIDFLFIDDGSKIPLKVDWADVIRIDKDVAWNQPVCNNIGFEAIHGDCLRMDIDHYFLAEDLKKINNIKVGVNEIVTFKRESLHPHPNIFMCRPQDVLNAGGYNESFAGNYGYDDVELMKRLKREGFTFTECPIEVKVNRGLERHGLKRDFSVNKAKYEKGNY